VTHPSFLRRLAGWVLLRPRPVLLTLVLLLYGSADPTRAQQADSTLLRQFQRANAYARAEKTEKAIKLLESLHAEAPSNTAFYRKLKEAYESVKRYDEALRLVEERIGDSPTVSLLSEKARLQYQKGAVETANETWDRALRLAPQEPQTYRTVYQTLVDIRHFRKAIEVLKQGRTVLDRPDAFRTELANLYGLDGQFEEAMTEYVQLLAEDPERVGYVRNQLQTFVEQGQGIEASIEVLRETVQEAPLNRSYRQLLAWLYMEQNDYAAAFDVYRALDRLGKREGELLFDFARKAANAQRYDVATTACTSVLDRYPDSDVAPDVQKTLGDLYRQWADLETDSSTAAADSARYEKARAAYKTFLESHPGHSDSPSTLLQLGTLQLDAFRALDKAEATLNRLVSNYPQTVAAEKGQYHQARLALFRGDLNRARLLFSRLSSEAQESDLADRAKYELALLHFYEGEFDAATARAKATSQNTAADVANDAIELKTLIQENRGPDSLDVALQTFAQSRLYKRQRRRRTALAQLDTLLQNHPRHPLADNARFQQGTVHLARRDTAAALETFRALPKRHPRSPYADRSLFRAGTLLEASGRPAAAAEVYNRLLTEYPKSLLAGDARGRLRALQQTQG
jgi:tetratricopeptide (TPR) repeat protein